jgi:hypothetical protein
MEVLDQYESMVHRAAMIDRKVGSEKMREAALDPAVFVPTS